MTATDLERISAPRPPAPHSEATAVEQSRAIAEVQAAVVVAQQCPRSIDEAVRQMRESCAQQALADRAFFRFPRAGQTVSGPSIHLARELARCWGNVQYGISELRRDDKDHTSEMIAWAWDVQTNTRSSSTFIVPHERDTKKGRQKLTDLRDVYENNANQGARRVREAIFSVLPAWFTEEAKERANATLSNGGGKTVAQQVGDLVTAFEALGVTKADLESKVGRKSSEWIEQDLATLRVVGGSLKRGETTREEEFGDNQPTAAPSKAVTADEIKGTAPAADEKLPDPNDGTDPWKGNES